MAKVVKTILVQDRRLAEDIMNKAIQDRDILIMMQNEYINGLTGVLNEDK